MELLLHRDSSSGGQKAAASLLATTPSAESKCGRLAHWEVQRQRLPPYGRLAITLLPNKEDCRRQQKQARCGRSFNGIHQAPCLRITAPQYLSGYRTLCLPARLYALLLTALVYVVEIFVPVSQEYRHQHPTYHTTTLTETLTKPRKTKLKFVVTFKKKTIIQ